MSGLLRASLEELEAINARTIPPSLAPDWSVGLLIIAGAALLAWGITGLIR